MQTATTTINSGDNDPQHHTGRHEATPTTDNVPMTTTTTFSTHDTTIRATRATTTPAFSRARDANASQVFGMFFFSFCLFFQLLTIYNLDYVYQPP